MNGFVTANFLDLIVVILTVLPTFIVILVDKNQRPRTFYRATVALGLLFAFDSGLQLWSIGLAYTSVVSDADHIWQARCLNHQGDRVLTEFMEGIKTIRYLGWTELGITVTSGALDVYGIFHKEDYPEKAFRALLCFADLVLSAIEFAVFTLDTQSSIDALFEALSTEEVDGVAWCVQVVPGPHFYSERCRVSR